jgi:hypothetical protein
MNSKGNGYLGRSLMRFGPLSLALAAMLTLSGCGGGDAFSSGEPEVPEEPTAVASITLTPTSTTMGTSTASSVGLTAVVKDSLGRLLAGEAVNFQTTNADLVQDDTQTDAGGKVTATLTPGTDKSNRSISVTATAGDYSASTTITAQGTSIAISGPTTALFNQPQELTLVLRDSDGGVIGDQSVSVSGTGSTTVVPVSPATYTTDSNGQLRMSVTASANTTISASGAGASTTFALNVLSDQFQVTSTDGVELATGECHPMVATWLISGAPVANGQEVVFSTTRGTLHDTAADPTCNGAGASVLAAFTTGGDATVLAKSLSPGPVTISAAATGGPSAALQTSSFIATDPAALTLQAVQTTIGINQTTELVAVVRDASNNLVKNANVSFNVQGLGTISPATVTTDSLGRATATYTAPDTEADVVISATEQSTALVRSVPLTVTGIAAAITADLDPNRIAESSASLYRWSGDVLVVGNGGDPVNGATVTISLVPTAYFRGVRMWNGSTWVASDGTTTTTAAGVVINGPKGPCANEDYLTGDSTKDGDNALDAGEDENSNGILDPGMPVAVTTELTTDSSGTASFTLTYLKKYASWMDVYVVASTRVSGTEATDQLLARLPALKADVEDEEVTPPGMVSPFGPAPGPACTNPYL